MKSGPLFFIALLGVLTVSWASFALGPDMQLRTLAPYYDATFDSTFPQSPSGLAARGRAVYLELGCASCHTQQVRRSGFGSDHERGWGERQSWARDYIFQDPVQLGSLRHGPDVATVGDRIESEAELHEMLYSGSEGMPAYAYLYEPAPPAAQANPLAVDQVAGREIIPSRRAEALVAYLLNLKAPAAYAPEVANNAVEEGEAH
jgi:cytochrome c oxidase cbb3-type subunit 2